MENTVRHKRTRMVRSYPVHALKDVLSVAKAIQRSNSGLPFDRVLLAKEMDTTPASSAFTMRLNSSLRYGLTQGGYSDALIELTPRGQAIVAPRDDHEMSRALVDAAFQPELFRRFYEMLNGKRIPDDPYARNTLHREFGIHTNLAAEFLEIIKANGLYVGVVNEVRGALYVSLTSSIAEIHLPDDQHPTPAASHELEVGKGVTSSFKKPHLDSKLGRIFIGHIGCGEVVEFLVEALGTFQVPCTVLSGEIRNSLPIPIDISQEMRSCTAAILVIGRRMVSGDSLPVADIERSLIYLLGAMSVLYGGRILLFVEEGLEIERYAAGFARLHFEPGRYRDKGFNLFKSLREAGLIEVTATVGT